MSDQMDRPLEEAPSSVPGYSLPGYDTALARVVSEGCFILTTGQLPNPWNSSGTSYTQAAQRCDIDCQLVDGTEVPTAQRVSHELVNDLDDALVGKYSTVFDQLSIQCLEAAQEMEGKALETLAKICEASGQEATTRNDADQFDMFLQALEMSRIQFNSLGEPVFTACFLVRESSLGRKYVPYIEIINALNARGSEEQKSRFRDTVENQRNEWHSGKRHF